MMNRHRFSALILLVVIALLMSVLTGCSQKDNVTVSSAGVLSSEVASKPTDGPTDVNMEQPAASPTTNPTDTPESTQKNSADELDDTQRNSIGMLNYLTVLTKEINASKNSRLYLEEVYSSLINNTYPNAVDSRTLTQLNSLLDTLENYRMVTVKRNRLQYIYEQNRAQALSEAVPNPLGLMSVVQSFSLSKIAASIIYMAVDSYSSYTTYTAQADLQYLKDGWALDDEAAAALHNSRKDTFSYMVRIVGEYNLPGDLVLSEKAIDEFVEWKNNSNVVQRIQFFEFNKDTYQALGAYWLALAQSYYDNGDYSKCIEAVSSYEALATRIYRKDYGLSTILPLAIVSAGEVLDGDEYIDAAAKYAELIISNTDNDEWSLRYFAAQAYVELYAKTRDPSYLEKSYAIALENVNYLVSEQKAMNAEFLSDVMEEAVPKDATKKEKAEIESYNKQIKEERKTALAPIYEPLRLNCDLLFSLAQELNIAESEKTKIDGILHENGESIFLIPSIDALYRFRPAAETTTVEAIEVSFYGKELTLPAKYVSEDSVIKVTVTGLGSDAPVVFEDWKIVKVERKDKNDFDSFTATFKCSTAEKYKYNIGATIHIDITPKTNNADTLSISFTTFNTKEEWWEFVKVWDNGIAFNREK